MTQIFRSSNCTDASSQTKSPDYCLGLVDLVDVACDSKFYYVNIAATSLESSQDWDSGNSGRVIMLMTLNAD